MLTSGRDSGGIWWYDLLPRCLASRAVLRRPFNSSDTPHGQYGDGPDDGADPGGHVKHAVVAAADRQDGRRARRRDGEGERASDVEHTEIFGDVVFAR